MTVAKVVPVEEMTDRMLNQRFFKLAGTQQDNTKKQFKQMLRENREQAMRTLLNRSEGKEEPKDTTISFNKYLRIVSVNILRRFNGNPQLKRKCGITSAHIKKVITDIHNRVNVFDLWKSGVEIPEAVNQLHKMYLQTI